MCCHRQGGCDPEWEGGEHRGPNNGAVGEAVHPATDEDQGGVGVVRVAVVGVAVTPDDELFEHEEAEDPREQRSQRGRGLQGLERFRYQCQQRHSQQGADGVTDQSWHQRQTRLPPQQQER